MGNLVGSNKEKNRKRVKKLHRILRITVTSHNPMAGYNEEHTHSYPYLETGKLVQGQWYTSCDEIIPNLFLGDMYVYTI